MKQFIAMLIIVAGFMGIIGWVGLMQDASDRPPKEQDAGVSYIEAHGLLQVDEILGYNDEFPNVLGFTEYAFIDIDSNNVFMQSGGRVQESVWVPIRVDVNGMVICSPKSFPDYELSWEVTPGVTIE